MSVLSAFTTQLVNLFDELCTTYPEDRDIRMATEAIKGAKKINPRLILDLFVDHVYRESAQTIYHRDAVLFRQMAQQKISTQFNEMVAALAVFDKYWDTMGTANQDVIWQYLKVLCVLAEKAQQE
jgi:hypothetical protein